MSPAGRLYIMVGVSSMHDGTAWTNCSTPAMIPAVRHEAMLPHRVSARGAQWRRRPYAGDGCSPYPFDRRQTMSELDARYARGQDTRHMFGGGTITSAGSAPGAWDVTPGSSGYSAKRLRYHLAQ